MSVSLVKTTVMYPCTPAGDVARLTALASQDRGDAPGSRYGTRWSSYVPFAVAATMVMVDSNGGSEDEEIILGEMIGLTVNDYACLAEFIVTGWHVIPRSLRQELGGLRTVRALAAG